jgi:hypothetical protein
VIRIQPMNYRLHTTICTWNQSCDRLT